MTPDDVPLRWIQRIFLREKFEELNEGWVKQNVVGKERGEEGEGEDDDKRNGVWTMKENFEGLSE